MENLKALSNQELHVKTVGLAEKERTLGVEILRHLREIERRRFYAVLGYPSLWEYCVTELKYSAGAAQRRICAMRLIKELPSVEGALQEGRLNLTVVASAQRFLRDQKKTASSKLSGREELGTSGAGGKAKPITTVAQKIDLLKSLENKSTREAEKIFATLAPEAVPTEQRRVLTENQIEVRFVLDAQLNSDLERIKDVAAGALGMNPTYAELFRWMAAKVLHQIDPKRKAERAEKRAEVKKQAAPISKPCDVESPPAPEVAGSSRTDQFKDVKKPAPNRYIPATHRHKLYVRDDNEGCEYFDPISGRQCREKRGLEVDHVVAYALGGTNTRENLRILCKTHNLLHAEKTFGAEWIGRYWPR